MGIGFVLIVYAVGGTIAAMIGCLVLRRVVTGFVPGSSRSRSLLIRAVTTFPFACLFWAGGVFVFSATVNVLWLHRDVGIGDGFDCPLPDGYALSFIDRTDVGTVYRSNPVWSSDVRQNAVDDVTAMQLAGPYILGSVESHRREHFEEEISAPESWFLLNTTTGERTDFKTLEGLSDSARQREITLSLVPIGDLYSKYRFTWFDALAGGLLVVPPLLTLALLTRWTLRLRRNS